MAVIPSAYTLIVYTQDKDVSMFWGFPTYDFHFQPQEIDTGTSLPTLGFPKSVFNNIQL